MPLRTRCFASCARTVGQADDHERRQPVLVDVRLDLDATRLEPDERMGDGACKHASTLRRKPPRLPNAFRTTPCVNDAMSLMILVAGPARGGTGDDPDKIAHNIDEMTRAGRASSSAATCPSSANGSQFR